MLGHRKGGSKHVNILITIQSVSTLKSEGKGPQFLELKLKLNFAYILPFFFKLLANFLRVMRPGALKVF